MKVANAFPAQVSRMGRELHIRSHPSAAEHWRHVVEIAALIGAAVWAVYVFIYQERIKPAASPVAIERSVTLHHDDLRRGKQLVTVHVEMKNIGHKTASPAALIVNVYGVRYSNQLSDRMYSPIPGLTEIDRSLQSDPPRLLYSYRNIWKPLGGIRQIILNEGESESSSFVFAVPSNAYDMVSLETFLCYAASSDSRQWNMAMSRRGHGSFWLTRGKNEDYSGLTCVARRTGEYFAL